jgi:hypothetical protein
MVACRRVNSIVICLLYMRRGRVIAAYIVSPFAGAIYLVVLLWLLNNRDPNMLRDYVGILSTIGLFAIIGYFGEGIATPIICLLRSRSHMNLRWFLLGGLVVGVWMWLFWSLYLIQLFVATSFTFKLMFGLLGCIAPALISTTLFWFLGWSADNKSLDASGGSASRN